MSLIFHPSLTFYNSIFIAVLNQLSKMILQWFQLLINSVSYYFSYFPSTISEYHIYLNFYLFAIFFPFRLTIIYRYAAYLAIAIHWVGKSHYIFSILFKHARKARIYYYEWEMAFRSGCSVVGNTSNITETPTNLVLGDFYGMKVSDSLMKTSTNLVLGDFDDVRLPHYMYLENKSCFFFQLVERMNRIDEITLLR